MTKLSIGLTAAVCLSVAYAPQLLLAQSREIDSHIAIENPASLSNNEANQIYDRLKESMADSYALSRLAIVEDYQSWKLFSDAPYMSATHGQRYVNSYANEIARNYDSLQIGETLPVGSVLAKDSITILDDKSVYAGALFIMEKLPEGQSPATADWRYVMVIPDGSLFGDTHGERSELMAYCHECHLSVAERDHTFFVPEEYRVSN